MKNLLLLNPENIPDSEANGFRLREASRAVVFDDDGMIALLHVTKRNFYKLPGGGIESEEDRALALKRECKEEIGCNIEVVNEIGIITEYNKAIHLKQISYCYLAKVVGQKGTPNFTEKEINDGFEPVWLSYEDAINALKSNVDGTTGNPYIKQRDLTFLTEAKQYLN